MDAVIERLRVKGLLEESEGAQVVHLDEEGMPPCLIRKADGATLYATRDLAAAVHRHDVFGFDRAIYVTDRGQALHFRQIVRVLEKAGYEWASSIRHVPFGVIRMGGKRTKTREGSVVLLRDVFDEAVEKVRGLIREKNPDLEDADRVAGEVGIGAVVFSDLKNRRENDIDFDLDQVVAFEGKTGPYVMYSHARACSILSKAGEAVRPASKIDPSLLGHDAEHQLVRLLAAFPDRVDLARERDEPSEVASHLLDLCEAFHAYHTLGGRDRALRVLADDADLRAARLALTDAVRQALRSGLDLLGMAAPERM
jgi:arginyl-tRNA synthetase